MKFFQQKSIYLAVILAMQALTAVAETATESLPEVSVSGNKIKAGAPYDAARTGSKTDAPLRDVPASVSVVPAALLREEGALTMNDAMRNVSSVQVQHGGGYGYANNYNSRGLAINFLRDDLPDGTAQNGYFRTMYDIDRIEVLKGPGSALFGSGGPGGSINVVTKKPQAKYNLEVGGTFGSFDTKNGYMDLTGTVAEGVTGRLIADTESTDDIRGLSRNISEFSPSILWAYDTDKSLLVDVDVRKINVTPDNYGILFDTKRKIANVSDKTRYYSPMDYSEQNITRVGVTHDWAITSDLSMRTAFSNDSRDLDFIRNAGGDPGDKTGKSTGRNLREQHEDARYTTLQNELTWKVDTGTFKHTVLAGYEYKNTNNDTLRIGYTLLPIANVNKPVVLETTVAGLAKIVGQGFDREVTSETHSVYLQDQIALNEQFKVRAGLRNDHIHFEDKGLQANVFRKIEETKNLTTGSLGAVYQPTPTLAFYTGYANGKFVNLATESQAIALEPEKSEQYEIGAKTSFFGDKVNLNIAYFDTKRENYFITLVAGGIATPDGKDASKGVEFDVTASPIDGWNINANAVLMDVETKSRNLATNNRTNLGNITRSIYGTRPTGVSEQLFSIWNSYTIQGGIAKGFTFGIGANYRGDAYGDNLNIYKTPAYTVYDAAISYKQPKWEAALNFKNITDKTYYTSPTFAGVLPGDPRSAYLTVRYDFK